MLESPKTKLLPYQIRDKDAEKLVEGAA